MENWTLVSSLFHQCGQTWQAIRSDFFKVGDTHSFLCESWWAGADSNLLSCCPFDRWAETPIKFDVELISSTNLAIHIRSLQVTLSPPYFPWPLSYIDVIYWNLLWPILPLTIITINHLPLTNIRDNQGMTRLASKTALLIHWHSLNVFLGPRPGRILELMEANGLRMVLALV